MLSYLPTIHKNFALKMGLIFIIFLFTTTILISFWHFIPFFAEQAGPTAGPTSRINTDYSFITNPQAGSDWILDITIYNEGQVAAHSVEVQVMQDAVIEGGKAEIGTIMPNGVKTATITAKIKDNAPKGQHNVRIVTIAPGIDPFIKELPITVI